ncbi:4a-hydroxytetrahydrobiopterin dehydratase [soil metagenome]
MSMDLLSQHCTHLPEGTPPLTGEALEPYREAVHPRWKLTDDHHLEAEFSFPDFAAALAFTNEVGALAEAEDHHPEITLTWGKASVRVWTHTVGGVSPNDFILAARIDTLVRERGAGAGAGAED